ncbi:Ail/Lom family outer membrane beta-barrel protein, partial [Escherichia coli]|uniref:Ail/Lom family outer membrane beta-barrel protein n=1 Tax=Escherichia coli TaxID=562 RepID=UPI0029F5B212
DSKGKTHDVLTGSDDGRHSNTSLAWGAGVQFNPTESVAIDIAYEGSGSGDWRACHARTFQSSDILPGYVHAQ